jgi:hypothetical protein
MTLRAGGLFGMLALLAALCSGQTPRPAALLHYIEIKLPPEVASESFFARYVLAGEHFGGWVKPIPGVSSYFIGTTLNGRTATGIKAVLYAPGCAVRTLDLPLSAAETPPYSFICQPLPSNAIQGALARPDRPYWRDIHDVHGVNVQARYIAAWAQPFLGLDRGVVTGIPVGDAASLSADGHFRLTIPDLSRDPLAGAPDRAGEFRIWARDKTSNAATAQLIPSAPPLLRTPLGGLRIRSEYPSEISFSTKATDCPQHDAEGFAIRPDVSGGCDP